MKCIEDEIPFDLPDGWAWCRLRDIITVCSSKRVMQSEWTKSGVPFYRAREIVKLSKNGFVNNDLFISEEHYQRLKNSYDVPRAGDLMVTGVGTIGKAYIVKDTDRFYYKDASELIQIKIEHVELGYFDLYTKGGKLRRLYIPKKLRTETLEWLEDTNRSSGYLFLNRYGERITTRGISQQLKNYADKYGLDKKVVYPHSFRHRYAKNFLEKYNDIALLADLMGHESIETTRIYLRRTASEQQELVDKIVTW